MNLHVVVAGRTPGLLARGLNRRLRSASRIFAIGLVTVLSLAAAVPAAGQLSSQPAPRERVLPVAESVRSRMEEFRWRLGALKLEPIFSFQGPGYNNNVLGTPEGTEQGDWTATGAAGLNYIVPLGSKVFLAGEGSGSYTWYQKFTNLRQPGGVVSADLLALFNRLQIETGAAWKRTNVTATSELLVSTPQNETSLRANADLEVFRRFSVYGGAQQVTTRQVPVAEQGAYQDLSQLDRTETAYRAGARYSFRPFFSVGIGFETVETRFDSDLPGRDYDESGYMATVHYDQPRFYVDLQGGLREIKAVGVPGGEPYEDFMYQFFASYVVNRMLELQGFGGRRPVPSVTGVSTYLIETRNGLGARLTLGARTAISATAELGDNAYPAAAGLLDEDIERFGAELLIKFFREVKIVFGVTQTNYSSADPSRDRSVFQIQTGLKL